ncbi:MAG: radical SAM protein [Lachnospiraceae bacterium]|nr:radical SAM protein [Lachnospiraceae bacterium]
MNEYVKNLKRIEVVVTLACTGRCKHCSQGEHINCTGHVDVDIVKKSIREVCEHYDIESLMTFGGEPLIYPEAVCDIHKVATQMGIGKRQLITNGYFSKDFGRIEEVANNLKDSGVNEILLSIDAFHQETIPLEPVMYFAKCISKAGVPIKLSPAWLVSEDDDNEYNNQTRKLLKEFDELNLKIGSGNVIFPSGNALKYFGEYFEGKEFESPYEEDPRDVRAISFSPNGDVLDGNVYKNDILEIIKNYSFTE